MAGLAVSNYGDSIHIADAGRRVGCRRSANDSDFVAFGLCSLRKFPSDSIPTTGAVKKEAFRCYEVIHWLDRIGTGQINGDIGAARQVRDTTPRACEAALLFSSGATGPKALTTAFMPRQKRPAESDATNIVPAAEPVPRIKDRLAPA